MKYSIIIPTLNEEKLLPHLLVSLCNKDLKEKYNYEVIVSDGGSTDGTIKYSRLYADRILLHENGDIQNISSGREKGARFSKGSILIFLNADVRLDDLENYFICMEKYFIDSNYAAMTCRIKVYPELQKISDYLFAAFINIYVRILNLIGIGMIRGEFQVVKKNVYESIGGYNKNLFAGEDFELSTRIRKKGKIFFAPKLIVYESPRRYHKWGYFRIIASWFLNSTGSWLLNKSVSKTWEEVR